MKKHFDRVLCILLTAAALFGAAACSASGVAHDPAELLIPAKNLAPVAAENYPSVSFAEHTDTPQPMTDTPQPTTETPQPTTETPQPTTDTPQPTTDTPQPTAETPQPTTETPVPTTDTPQPTTETPQPTTNTSVPTTDTPQPTTDTPQPTTDTPQPTTETPDTDTPEPYVPASYTPFFPKEKVVAFTFDDGPDLWTGELLDVIDGTDDKVTFFVTGYMMDRSKNYATPYAEYTRRALAMGCDVGIHSYYHENVVYSTIKKIDCTPEVYKREILDLDEKLQTLFGFKPQLFRPMGGNYNPKRDYGYTTVLWSVDSYDWRTFDEYRPNGLLSDDPEIKAAVTAKAVNEIVDRILSQLHSGDIVLMHDIYYITRLAFAKIYPILKEMGYKLVTVSELLGIDPAEHHGQYFYATYFYGFQGKNTELKNKSSAVFAMPPKKREE